MKRFICALLGIYLSLQVRPALAQDHERPEVRTNVPVSVDPPPNPLTAAPTPSVLAWPNADTWRSLQTFGLFAAISLGPVGILMMTSFVRINIVLILLRQALGSPQVPGNQVLSALALLLTLLVMRPIGTEVYTKSISPYLENKVSAAQAWETGSRPIKKFMVDQIVRTNHQHYLTDLYDITTVPAPGRVEPVYGDEYPFLTLTTAFVLSEITTAIVIGFLIYLPFLVVDLVVSAVLAAMGLVMMPPTLVSMPLKLILFVLADGWFLVASRLMQTFAVGRG